MCVGGVHVRSGSDVVEDAFNNSGGFCSEFEPTWIALARQATRLEPARVNIDTEGGMELAERLGMLNEGIPAVGAGAATRPRRASILL